MKWNDRGALTGHCRGCGKPPGSTRVATLWDGLVRECAHFAAPSRIGAVILEGAEDPVGLSVVTCEPPPRLPFTAGRSPRETRLLPVA